MKQPQLSGVSRALALAGLAMALLAGPATSQDLLKSFEERTTVHTLKNGWTFLIVERPVVPVFSFCTLADVGSAQEVPGITGLAHMFEHMAFKGSPNLGTRDAAGEKKALEELEAAYQAYNRERLAARPDSAKVERLLAAFRDKQKAAAAFVVQNEFDDVITREGGAELNATTDTDKTRYFFSLPSNKTELFAFLESERFLHPVFREFYEERDVVQEERRASVESQAVGRMMEQFTAAAFSAHPYGNDIGGHMSDLQSFTITDAEAFFRTYYAPENLLTVVVGDVRAQELIPLVERYFGRIPARPGPAPLRTVEPPQIVEKTVVLEDPQAQPFYMEGYKKPANTHPDQPVYDAIDDILTGGRTSRLYRALVRDKKLAANVSGYTGFPGTKYPNLITFFVTPAFGVQNEQVQAALRDELERLKREDVSDAELARYKTRAKAQLLRQLRTNVGIAIEFAEYQNEYGDWRELFRSLDRLEKVTKEDIRRVANQVFQKSSRTVGMVVHKPQETPGSPQSSPAGAARTGGGAR
ncbi:MAG TPA: pitrilysin family protein [Thermoanaerobaculia bacterium]|nr:pitrilysin family protein [Thermoanaerobaculia bacterium]